MKKFLLTALVVISVISSSFAKGNSDVNYKVKNSFNAEFKGAENVEWTSTNDYVAASFVMNQKGTKAFYNHDGTFIGTASAISIDELPSAAKRSFAKKYGSYTVTEAIKFDKADGYVFYISAENAGAKLILQVDRDQLSIYKKLD